MIVPPAQSPDCKYRTMGYDHLEDVMIKARWQQIMEHTHGIGVLATIEEGQPRLRPMEFSLVDGQIWAATSRRSKKFADVPDGQHVEVLFMDDTFDHARVRGVLEWSFEREDRKRLWDLQHEDIVHWYSSADDPNLVILKIIPEEAEFKSSHGDDQYFREAA